MAHFASTAAQQLEKEGIDAEVIDVRQQICAILIVFGAKQIPTASSPEERW
jgi:hypothetical protein